jgi:hypothetical protein
MGTRGPDRQGTLLDVAQAFRPAWGGRMQSGRPKGFAVSSAERSALQVNGR